MRRRIFPNLIGDISQLEQRQAILERIMQVIGFSPENPYTLTVNDGTWNRVLIGKINGDYGIKIIDNAGNEIILANGTIVADAIKTGTLDCGLLTVANLSAGDISTGTMSANYISGGTIDAEDVKLINLDAEKITVGTFTRPNDRFTAGSLSGVKISDGTIIGTKLEAYTVKAQQINSNAIESDKIAAGAVIASKISVSQLSAISSNIGTIIAGSITADVINVGTLNANIIPGLNTSKLISGNYNVGWAGQPSIIYIKKGGDEYGDAKLVWEGGNSIWTDINNYIGMNAVGERIYFYTGSHIYALFQRGSPASFYSGIAITGGGIHFAEQHNIDNIDALIGFDDIRYVLGSNGYYHSFADAGWNEHLWISPWGGIWGHGDMHFDGGKYFTIQHPEDENKYIQYASIESPEVALKIRGRAKLIGGKAEVSLPHHWGLVTDKHLLTAQITPLGDCMGLYVSDLKLSKFTVMELQKGKSNIEFCWEITATRKGFKEFDVEPTKESIIEERVKKVIDMEKNDAKVKDKRKRSEKEMPIFKKKYKELTGKEYGYKKTKAGRKTHSTKSGE